ncbi:hypothetical protein PQZ11_01000 [Luminiphilus sp.]|nr:hypothetical protein [Luminiphilus sp.]
MAASTESLNYVQKMFIAFLGRAGAPDGMEYYAALIDADEESGKAILFDDLYYSDQGQALYGGKTTIEIIKIIFNNVMNRDPADAGLIYWYNAITDGTVNISEAAAIIADSAAATTADLAELTAKTTAADAITTELTNDSTLVAGYQTNFDLSRDSLGAVTAANVGSFDAATETSNVAAGYASNSTLTTGTDTIVGTAGFQDLVTGTVGTGATYAAADSITDAGTGDNDILTLTGDGNFTFGTVTKFESVNVNLSDTVGAGFTISGANLVTGATINIDVADTVEVVGVSLQGETVVTVAGALSSDVSTTDVTSLTAVAGGGAITITGDADLATVQVDDIADDGTTIVLSATAADIDLDGTADTNDTVTISAVGAVDLDLSDTVLVEEVSLSGNGAAVTYDVNATATGASMSYAVTGDQDVTIQGAPASLTAGSLTDTSTAGSTTIVLADAAGNADLTGYGALSGGVTVAVDLGNNELNAVGGNTIKFTAAQATGTLTIDANDAATDTAMTLDLDADTLGITTEDIDTLTIDLGTVARTIGGAGLEAQANNDTAVTIAGTNDLTMTDELATGNLTISVDDASLEEIDADGTVSATLSGNLILTAAFDSENDADITADDVDFQTTTTVQEGNLSITTTNDATLTGVVDVDGTLTVSSGGTALIESTSAVENDVTLTGDDVTIDGADNLGDLTVTAGNVTITATNDAQLDGDMTTTAGNISITAGGNVDVNGQFDASGTLTISQTGTAGSVNLDETVASDNDMTITGDDVEVNATTTVAGDMSITATGNDITTDGTIDASGNLTLTTQTALGGDIITTGQTVGADNDITMTSADLINAGAINTAAGNVVLTAGNEITIGTASDIDGTLTATSSGAAANGIITIGGALTMENDVSLTGDEVDVDANITVDVGSTTLTAANDVDIDANITSTAGSITVTANSGSVGAGADVIVGAAGNTLTASNDITLTGDDVTAGDLATTAAGALTVTATNDISMLGDFDGDAVTTVNTSATLTAGGDITLGNGTVIDANNDVTITASAGGDIDLDDAAITSDIAGNITITGGQIDGSGAITADDGNVVLHATNDSLTSTLSGTITSTTGSISTVGGTYAVTTMTANAGGVTIAGDASGTFTTVNANASAVRLTTSGDVTMTTVDTEIVAASGTGDYALGTVTSSTTALVQITTGTGDDSVTLNAADKYIVSMGDGADSVTATATAAASVINLGDGADTFTPTAAGFNGTVDGGDGSDTVVLASGDYSADGVWTNIEVLNVAGAVTLSEAQLDNDTTFQVKGANTTITATGVTSTDLSGVTFQAGNSTGFDITGHATADSTLTGSDAGDTLTGVAGDDTLSGGAGADTLEGGAGANTLTGGTGNDQFTAQAGTNVITDLATGDIVDVASGATATATLAGNFVATTASQNLGSAAADLAITAAAGGSVIDMDLMTVTTAASDGVTLIGAGGVDTITGSDGDDSITGGAGADTISPGAGDDTVYYSATTDAGTAGSLVVGAGDAIDSTWVQGGDKLGFIGDFLTANMTGTAASAVNAIANTAGIDFNASGTGDDTVQIIAGAGGNTAAIGDLTTLADLNAALGTITNETVGDERILIFNASTDAKAAIYYYTCVTADGALTADELQLLGIVDDNAIAAGDIVFV